MDLKYSHEDNIFTLIICSDEADFKIRIIAEENQELLLTIGYFPVKISKTNLDKMYKVINDLNDEHMIGAYVIDSDDGELVYRLANNVDDGAINKRVVLACFLQVYNRIKSTYAYIMKAMYGGGQYTFNFEAASVDDQRQRS